MSVLTFGKRHIVKGLDPVANAFAGTVYSDVVSMKEYSVARFIIHKGAGATGTATITVEACSDAAGNNPVAVPFQYQAYTGADDLPGAVAAATVAGFTTSAGASQLYVIEVDSQAMAGKGWVRLKSVEVVASAVLGGILIELLGPRYAADIPNTAIA
ncbi:MAG: hypothetical protein AB7O80_12860 [Acetobacteraceae bacterium]